MTPFDIPELVCIIIAYIIPKWWTEGHKRISLQYYLNTCENPIAYDEYHRMELMLSRLVRVNRCLASIIRPILWNYVYIPAKLENLVLELFELMMCSLKVSSGIGDPFNTLITCLDIPEPYCLWFASFLPFLKRIFVSLEDMFTLDDYFGHLDRIKLLCCVEEFSLVCNDKLQYDAVVSGLKFIPRLKVLRLSSGGMCSNFYVPVDTIVRDNAYLESLHISDHRIAFMNVECRPNTKLTRLGIQRFNMHDVKAVTELAMFTKKVRVTDLYVDVPHVELTYLGMQFPHVKKLRLDDCTEFKAIFDAFPNIEELCLNYVIFSSDYHFICKLMEGISTSGGQFKKLVILGSKGRLISKPWCSGPLSEAIGKYPELQGRDVTIYFPEDEQVCFSDE